MLNKKQNKEVEKLIEALIKDVHYEKTYPAHTAYYQLDFEKLRKSLGSFIQAQLKKQ